MEWTTKIPTEEGIELHNLKNLRQAEEDKPQDPTFLTTFGEILEHYVWEDFCSRYGYDEWCLNEGTASREETVKILREDAKTWHLI